MTSAKISVLHSGMNHSLRGRFGLLLFCLSLITYDVSFAQHEPLSNLRSVTVHNRTDSFYLSAFTIVEESFDLQALGHSKPVSQGGDFQLRGHYLIWEQNSLIRQSSDSLAFQATFRVLPYDLGRWASRFDSVLYRDGSMRVMESITVRPAPSGNPFISDHGIQYEGNFSRGLALGNRQDLVLNSNFDLRMSGSLGDGINVVAALSDNSIPLQPDGNTQQLQEFDRIFIQLSKGGSTLIGGDYNLQRPRSHFINYFKKTQGVQVSNVARLDKDRTLTNSVSLGGSRGKFARINIAVQEGNQGPYRLRGVEGERFIIVIAGTERIYLDGTLLVRGLEQDYIIDYNAGELTFTPNRQITKDVRIIAEYEYSDQSYNRSIFAAESIYETRKLRLSFQAYSEQDGKLSSGLVDLSAEDKRFLADLGDSTRSARASSVRLRPEGYDPSIVMYKLVDTLGFADVLVRSTDPDSARYTAKFTLVGDGRGDYVRIAAEANGEVYAWVAPDPATGARQGRYQPEVQLVAPRQQQMFAMGGALQLGGDGLWESEVSLSRLDQNRFSDLDSEDDYGFALMNRFSKSFSLRPDSSHAVSLVTEVQHEYLSASFQSLKPYRNAEFARDWNVTGLQQDQEHLAHASIALVRPGSFEFSYRLSGFLRQDLYDGVRHTAKALWQGNRYGVHALFDQLNTTSQGVESTFDRPRLDLSRKLGKNQQWTAGAYFEREKNAQRTIGLDSLERTSFYYDLTRFYIRKSNKEKWDLELNYQKRWDYAPIADRFLHATLADDVSIRTRWKGDSRSLLDATFTIRDLEVKRPDAVGAKGGLNYLGKMNHLLNLGKGALRMNTTYEISSGQEPKRTFQYLKVDPGQGVYTFLDLNEDGIQQINEFEIAPFQEQAEYIRVTILTNDFIATNNVIFNQSYSIDPRRAMKDKRSLLSKFSDQGSIRIQRKNLQSAGVSLWNPFTLNIADTSLVSISSQVRNVFYFNRSNPAYDIQYEWNDFRNRFVLTTGYESKKLLRHILRSRINFSRVISGLISLVRENNNQDSESFDSKDYQIQSWELNPEVTFQPTGTFRLTGKYSLANRKNDPSERSERATIHDLKVEATWNKLGKSSLRSNLSLVLIDFEGQRNGALEFAMLEGLKDGTNWIWGLSFDKKLVNNIRLNLSYDGRKSGEARVVHTARAQVSAFF